MPAAPVDLFARWGSDFGWASVAFIAVLISFFFVALAYMISELLRMPELQAWAKNELVEASVSMLLVALLFSGMVTLNAVTWQLAECHQIDCQISLGFDYLGNATLALRDNYIALLVFDAGIGTLGTMGASMFIPVTVTPTGIMLPGIGLSPLAGLSVVNGAVVNLADATALVIINLLAQEALLTFIKEHFFTFFLPLGLLLRTFALTRRLGATLIAFAIAGYIVFPLTLVFNKSALDYDKDVWYPSQVEHLGASPPVGWSVDEQWYTNKFSSDTTGHWDVDASQAGVIYFLSPYGQVEPGENVNLIFRMTAPPGEYGVIETDAGGTQKVLVQSAPYTSLPVSSPIQPSSEGTWAYKVDITTINATSCASDPDCGLGGSCDVSQGYCVLKAYASFDVMVKTPCDPEKWTCKLENAWERAKYVAGLITQSAWRGVVMVSRIGMSPFLLLTGSANFGTFGILTPQYEVLAAYDLLTCDPITAQQPCSTCSMVIGGSVDQSCPNYNVDYVPPVTGVLPRTWSIPSLVRDMVLVTVLTVVDIIIVVTAFRSISGALGGETQLAGLSKIV